MLLVRDGQRTPAAKRTDREIFKNDAFDRLRATHGDDFSSVTSRVSTIAGDVTRDGLGLNDADRALFASCDIVIHSAAAVSFDSPLDSAVEINLLGPSRIANLCNEIGITPHLVAVSTCYVAGNRRGNAPEQLVSDGPFDIGIDWRSEVAASRRLRSDADAASRSRENLERFRSEARTELGAAGAPALASKTEALRERWVKDQLDRGRARPSSERRVARCLRVHEGTRRTGADRRQGSGAGVDRAAVDHRVGARRAQARLDPRLPHGRAGPDLLRPRPARRVPRRPRGHRRRDPRRHRRRRRSSRSPRSAPSGRLRSRRSRRAASTR